MSNSDTWGLFLNELAATSRNRALAAQEAAQARTQDQQESLKEWLEHEEKALSDLAAHIAVTGALQTAVLTASKKVVDGNKQHPAVDNIQEILAEGRRLRKAGYDWNQIRELGTQAGKEGQVVANQLRPRG